MLEIFKAWFEIEEKNKYIVILMLYIQYIYNFT